MPYTTVRAYTIEHCPRYTTSEPDLRLAENLLVQDALWNAVRFALVGRRNRSVELRLSAHAEDRSVRVALLVADPSDGAVSDASDAGEDDGLVARLLPDDYAWSAVPPNGLAALEPPRPVGSAWRVARLMRRVEYFDLPVALPGLGPGTVDAAQVASAQAQAEGRSADGSALSELIASTIAGQTGERLLPVIGPPLRSQLLASPLCLPLLGEMIEVMPDRRRLCAELQLGAPAVLSVAMHPVETVVLDDDRSTATYFRRCLEPYRYTLAGAGFSQMGLLDQVYGRYWLPPSHLCRMTVRVAGLDDERAVALAQVLACYLGGLRAFQVVPPSRGVASLATLADPEADVASGQGLARHVEKLREQLRERRVAFESDYAGFLLRMPHLFTLDEARRLLRLPISSESGLPGIPTRMVAPFYNTAIGYQPLGTAVPLDRLPIGLAAPAGGGAGDARALHRKANTHWYHIDIDDMAKHALIVGTPGSGKSSTTAFLVRELTRRGIPVWVVEPVRTEYYDRLRPHVPGLVRRRFTGNRDGSTASGYLAFDPLRLPEGIEVLRHISYLKSCFEAAFPMDEFLAMMLENGLHEYYGTVCGLASSRCGGYQAHRVVQCDEPGRRAGVYPSFDTFCSFFLETYIRREMDEMAAGFSRSSAGAEKLLLWQSYFNRRFKNLRLGPLGQSFRKADDLARKSLSANYSLLANLLKKNAVIELDAVPDPEQKALIMALLLTFLFETRQAEDRQARESGRPPSGNRLRHVLIIEEAHRLLARPAQATHRGESVGLTASAKAVSLFVDMLAEVRAYGQGIAIIEQIPSKIVSEAVKNTNLKLMLRLTSREDRDFLGEAMNFDERQKDFVTSLSTGQFAAFSDAHDQPALLSLPPEAEWPGLFPPEDPAPQP